MIRCVYFKTPEMAVACNWKVASASTALAILQKFYPGNLKSVRVIGGEPATPESIAQARLRGMVPQF